MPSQTNNPSSEDFLEGVVANWQKPKSGKGAGDFSDLIIRSYGLKAKPDEVVEDGNVMVRQAEGVARKILELRPGKAFINADYDVDGTSAAAILGGSLRALGWDVRVFIPDRFENAYGVNREEIQRAWDGEKFDLLVAADCGATEMQWLGEFGQKNNISVMVVDHHKKTPHDDLGIIEINPQNHLAQGVHEQGYCTAVLAGLIAKFIYQARGQEAPAKIDVLAGMAAMADVTSMQCSAARYYAAAFLNSKEGSFAALDALVAVSKASRPLGTSDASFKIIPMLNAAGRMRNATVLVALWDCDDYQECLRVAGRLWTLNRERRKLQEEVVSQAMRKHKTGDKVLLAWDDSWHPGVVGPAAGQISERLGIPVFLGGFMAQQGFYSFSGRSVEGGDIYELLQKSAEGLPVQFGGHRVALGLKVKRENAGCLEDLKKRMETVAVEADKPVRKLAALLRPSSVNFLNYQAIQKLEPFGNEFPAPVFCVANLQIRLSPLANIADSASGIATDGNGNSFPVIVFRSPKLSQLRNVRGHLVGEMVCSDNGGNGAEQVVKLLVKDIVLTTP